MANYVNDKTYYAYSVITIIKLPHNPIITQASN